MAAVTWKKDDKCDLETTLSYIRGDVKQIVVTKKQTDNVNFHNPTEEAIEVIIVYTPQLSDEYD